MGADHLEDKDVLSAARRRLASSRRTLTEGRQEAAISREAIRQSRALLDVAVFTPETRPGWRG